MPTHTSPPSMLVSRFSYSSPHGYVYTPPTPISISVDKCTSRPGFGERFAYCRYTTNPYSTTYYAYNPTMSILEDNRSGNLGDSFNMYMAKMAVQPRYGFNIGRAGSVAKNSEDNPDRAINAYRQNSNCGRGTSKYWLTPQYWQSEREKTRTKAHNWAMRQ